MERSLSFQVLKKYGSVQTLKGVAMDGPSTNTGHKSGSIRYLEELLGRALQWQICAQHLNELVFKHLFRELGKNLSHFHNSLLQSSHPTKNQELLVQNGKVYCLKLKSYEFQEFYCYKLHIGIAKFFGTSPFSNCFDL